MFCTKCGKQISDSAKFCTICGNPVAGQSVALKKEAIQSTAVTEPSLLQEKLYKQYVIAAFACIASTIIIDLIQGSFFVGDTYTLDALIFPLLLISAKKTYYKKLGIASFILVGFQLLLAIIILCYAIFSGDGPGAAPSILKKLNFNGSFAFHQLRLFILLPKISSFISPLISIFLSSLRDFLYILANAICGIAFLKLSKFPEEKQ